MGTPQILRCLLLGGSRHGEYMSVVCVLHRLLLPVRGVHPQRVEEYTRKDIGPSLTVFVYEDADVHKMEEKDKHAYS